MPQQACAWQAPDEGGGCCRRQSCCVCVCVLLEAQNLSYVIHYILTVNIWSKVEPRAPDPDASGFSLDAPARVMDRGGRPSAPVSRKLPDAAQQVPQP